MEKRKRIEATQQLPKEMIQHIQSFLTGKEAVRTSILSKSWYEAWLTRPNLHFSDREIWNDRVFERFANKTVQRYEDSNIQIQSFKLKAYKVSVSTAKELILKAMKLGATDLDISGLFLLPEEVLGSESLVRLSLVGNRIDMLYDKVRCSRLKSLKLFQVSIEVNNIWDIIVKCPLLEEFALSICMDYLTYRKCVFKPESGVHKLKVLRLGPGPVEIGEEFFRDLSAKFPCLKELTLKYCTGYNEIQICSNSLEHIVFCHNSSSRVLWAGFDVPQIRKFKYRSTNIPSLSFKTISREWESDITFGFVFGFSWVVKLREFLLELELSSSKISLCLSINIPEERCQYPCRPINLPKAIVEKLRLQMASPSSVQMLHLEDLFWGFRPKIITPQNRMTDIYKVVKLICNTLIMIKEECENWSALYDLEEVNVQVSGCIAWTWTWLLPTKPLDASGWFGKDICLQLKWG